MGLPIQQLEKQILKEHELALNHARSAVEHALQCGRLLCAYRAAVPVGDWCARLEKLGIARTTAARYEKLANDAAKNPGKVRYLLEQGASLVDLYRAFDLVKPLQVGPYKPEDHQRRVAEAQLEMPFSYEEFVPHIRALVKAKNVEELSESTRRRLLTEVEAAAARLRESLKDSAAIDLSPDHQP